MEMKKSRFTDSQIMDALKRMESSISVPDMCGELGISTETLYKWRAKFCCMGTSMMSKMKELQRRTDGCDGCTSKRS
jgi:putative transposase